MGSKVSKRYDPPSTDQSNEDPLRSEYSWFLAVAVQIFLFQMPGVLS